MTARSNQSDIAEAISATFISPNEADSNLEPANVVDGLFFIGRAIYALSKSIDRLGTNNASTNMGALELIAKELRDGFANVESAIEPFRYDDVEEDTTE